MISYASIGKVEEKNVTLNVEIVESETSKFLQPYHRPSEEMSMNLDELTSAIGETVEGDFIIVEHDGVEILRVCGKDDKEKRRRLEEELALRL